MWGWRQRSTTERVWRIVVGAHDLEATVNQRSSNTDSGKSAPPALSARTAATERGEFALGFGSGASHGSGAVALLSGLGIDPGIDPEYPRTRCSLPYLTSHVPTMADSPTAVMGRHGPSWATWARKRGERPLKGPLTRGYVERTTRLEPATLTLATRMEPSNPSENPLIHAVLSGFRPANPAPSSHTVYRYTITRHRPHGPQTPPLGGAVPDRGIT